MQNLWKMVVIFPIVIFGLNSCASLKSGLAGQNDLRENAIEMKVTGRKGWTFNKCLKFGRFYTSKFYSGSMKTDSEEPGNNGWHFNLFEESYSNTKQHFQFKQYDSLGNSAEVMCTAMRNAKTIHYTKSLSGEDVYVDDYKVDIYLNGLEYKIVFSKDSIYSILIDGKLITIIHDYKYDLKEKQIFEGILFKQDNLVVAAVNTLSNGIYWSKNMNEGLVWIRNNLENNCKLLIAAISTAILLKPNLENTK